MTRRFFALPVAFSAVMAASAVNPGLKTDAPVQSADCGIIERVYLNPPQLNDTIAIDVWLPSFYYDRPDERYQVVYMHDGKNLYDAETTWNHQSWEMDRAMCGLIEEGTVPPAIIVGVHSSPAKRVLELMPQKAVEGTDALRATLERAGLSGMAPRGDAYAAFLVQILKPFIDFHYRTLPDRENTSLMGSSMGGLMSIYALCEYPDDFGNAACLSTHWIGAPEVADDFEACMTRYLDEKLPSPEGRRLYFDHGTETLDALYGPHEERVLRLIRSKGYDGEHLLNYVAEGAAHDEDSWSRRVAIPLKFILNHPSSTAEASN